jgi:hypothetical protein
MRKTFAQMLSAWSGREWRRVARPALGRTMR